MGGNNETCKVASPIDGRMGNNGDIYQAVSGSSVPILLRFVKNN